MGYFDSLIKTFPPIKYYSSGQKLLNDPTYKESQSRTQLEILKTPTRTEIINYILSRKNNQKLYLEIGTANPESNFNHINADIKYCVDPVSENPKYPVNFKMTSDKFFKLLSENKILTSKIKFDVIFIDGLHLAEQVDKDIINSLRIINDDGFIVLHDCNPPTEWHSRENYSFFNSPAKYYWNGTTWKAFLKWRFNPSVYSCCIDSDWGVGIISNQIPIGKSIKHENQFYEYHILNINRKKYLNLISFEDFKKLLF